LCAGARGESRAHLTALGRSTPVSPFLASPHRRQQVQRRGHQLFTDFICGRPQLRLDFIWAAHLL
jgi:hypothetical protein